MNDVADRRSRWPSIHGILAAETLTQAPKKPTLLAAAVFSYSCLGLVMALSLSQAAGTRGDWGEEGFSFLARF